MIEPTDKQIIKTILEKEADIFSLSVKPLGDYYHSFIRKYRARDRGLEEAIDLTNYLFNENGLINQLEETIALSLYIIPASKDELRYLKKIREDRDSIFEIIKKGKEKQFLYPEEVAELLTYFNRVRTYVDYRVGLNYCRKYLLDRDIKKGTRELLNKHEKLISAYIFAYLSRDKFYLSSDIFKWGFLVLFSIDAHDNSLLEKLSKGENVLFTYLPEKGLESTIFNEEKRKSMVENVKKALRERKEREKACLSQLQREWFDKEKIRKYKERLFSNFTSYIL